MVLEDAQRPVDDDNKRRDGSRTLSVSTAAGGNMLSGSENMSEDARCLGCRIGSEDAQRLRCRIRSDDARRLRCRKVAARLSL